MHRPRPIPPEEFTASGDLAFEGAGLGAGGMQLLDHRARGFAARILPKSGGQNNADYAFVPVNEATAQFASVNDPVLTGDGVRLFARERRGNLTVPTDGTAVVWLERLWGAAGYGFVYEASSGGAAARVYDEVQESLSWDITTDNAWEDMTSGGFDTLDLPSAGEYRIYGRIAFFMSFSAIGAFGNPWIATRIYNATAGAAVGGTFLHYAVHPSATNKNAHSTMSFTVNYTVSGANSLRWEAFRQSATGYTYAVARVGSTVALNPEANVVLGYEKLTS